MQLRLPTAASHPVLPVAATAAVAGASGLCVLIAYVTSPMIAIGLPVVAAVLAAILFQPMVGVYLGVLAAALEDYKLGGSNGFTVAELLFLVAAGSTALHALVARRLRWPPDTPHLAFIALLLIAVAGMFVAADPFAVAKVVLAWTAFLVLSLLVAHATRAQLRGLILAIALSGAILGAMAIPNAGQLQLLAGGGIASGRAVGPFTSPNLLGFFLVLTLTPALALALRAHGLARLPMAAMAGLIFAGLMLTLSRSAIIGAVVSVAVMLVSPAFRRMVAVLLVLVAIGAVVDRPLVGGSREVTIVRTRLGTFGEASRSNPRLQIYRAAPTIIGAHPLLGIGEANFPGTSARYGLRDLGGDVFQHAHNVPLTIAIETGLLGLCAFVVFLAGTVRAMVRAVRNRWHGDHALALGVVAALVGFLVSSMTDYPLRSGVVMAVLMLEVGAVVAYARLAATERLGAGAGRR